MRRRYAVSCTPTPTYNPKEHIIKQERSPNPHRSTTVVERHSCTICNERFALKEPFTETKEGKAHEHCAKNRRLVTLRALLMQSATPLKIVHKRPF